jgi:hypothetical protein
MADTHFYDEQEDNKTTTEGKLIQHKESCSYNGKTLNAEKESNEIDSRAASG